MLEDLRFRAAVVDLEVSDEQAAALRDAFVGDRLEQSGYLLDYH